MHRKDFLRLAGADQQAAQYLPIALLLRSGYGCAGYYNTEINHGLDDIVVLLNARLIALNNRADGGPVLNDFNDFLEEVVMQYFKVGDAGDAEVSDRFGKSIPMAAIPLNEISVLYPVAQIGRVMHYVKSHAQGVKGADPAHSIAGAVNRPGSNTTLLTGVIEPPATPPAPAKAGPAPAQAAASKGGSSPEETISSQEEAVPAFLDFNNKSIVLAVLRTKIW